MGCCIPVPRYIRILSRVCVACECFFLSFCCFDTLSCVSYRFLRSVPFIRPLLGAFYRCSSGVPYISLSCRACMYFLGCFSSPLGKSRGARLHPAPAAESGHNGKHFGGFVANLDSRVAKWRSQQPAHAVWLSCGGGGGGGSGGGGGGAARFADLFSFEGMHGMIYQCLRFFSCLCESLGTNNGRSGSTMFFSGRIICAAWVSTCFRVAYTWYDLFM